MKIDFNCLRSPAGEGYPVSAILISYSDGRYRYSNTTARWRKTTQSNNSITCVRRQ